MLLIPHPNGIVVHQGANSGNNGLIFQQVTIATNGKILFHQGYQSMSTLMLAQNY
jgi:serine acetyltransferase